MPCLSPWRVNIRIARGGKHIEKNAQESLAARCIQYTNGFIAVKEKVRFIAVEKASTFLIRG
jgi:hypothetical protein